MKKILCFLITAALALHTVTLSSCEKTRQKFTEYSFEYFDTVTTIVGYADSKEEFDGVAGDVLNELAEYHRLFTIYHRFEGLNNLCTVNELTNGVHPAVTVDEKIIDMLLYAKEMYALTDGKVNIAMGSVLSIWHDYRSEGMNDPAAAKLPDTESLKEAAEHTDINDLIIDTENNTVTLSDSEMKLDVGAIAKGYAVEMTARSLEERGISGYVINVGGNVRAVGSKPDGKSWTAGIENPEDTTADYIAYLGLTNEALVTSGSYQRYYVVDGERYHHIIDPETLMPADGYLSVSVVCGDSGLGDALSTALFCMPLSEGMELVESLTDVEAMWVIGDGSKHFSAGFEKYITN